MVQQLSRYISPALHCCPIVGNVERCSGLIGVVEAAVRRLSVAEIGSEGKEIKTDGKLM